jgi:hypothetical protein
LEKVTLEKTVVPETGFDDMVFPFFMIAFVCSAFYAAYVIRKNLSFTF